MCSGETANQLQTFYRSGNGSQTIANMKKMARPRHSQFSSTLTLTHSHLEPLETTRVHSHWPNIWFWNSSKLSLAIAIREIWQLRLQHHPAGYQKCIEMPHYQDISIIYIYILYNIIYIYIYSYIIISGGCFSFCRILLRYSDRSTGIPQAPSLRLRG